ncbi:phosphoribosylglycinamide formyltransferase, partial [Burkholderia multivorans]
ADVEIVAIGSDSPTAGVLARAESADIPTFVVRPRDFSDRDAWNVRLRDTVADLDPDWVVSAGFMRILGADFIAAFDQRIINTHPALLPAFPGAH